MEIAGSVFKADYPGPYMSVQLRRRWYELRMRRILHLRRIGIGCRSRYLLPGVADARNFSELADSLMNSPVILLTVLTAVSSHLTTCATKKVALEVLTAKTGLGTHLRLGFLICRVSNNENIVSNLLIEDETQSKGSLMM